MNVQEFISSGILEAYVLGEVTAEERLQVETYMRDYPEVREEVREIELTQETLLENAAIQPDSHLKESILANLPEKKAARDNVRSIAPASTWRWVAVASILLALLSGALAFNYYRNWQDAQNELVNLVAQNQEIASNYNNVRSELDQIQSDLNVIGNPDYSRIQLKRDGGNSEAIVYWNESTEEVYLKTISLEQLAEDQQYQLWALIDGQPVDAGVFDGGPEGVLRMKNIAAADAFAVTVEPYGGSENPTLSALQISGETL